VKSKSDSDVQKAPEGGFSRRGFLQGVGIGSGAIGTGILETEAKAAPAGEAVGPGEVPIILSINGTERRLEVEPRVTLLDALRNHLDLTGAKRVCDRGTCGACTVLVDGKAVYACTMLAIDAQGRRIETIESLSTDDELHPVMKAFVNNDAQQCGFCTPGFVVASKAFLDENPYPSEEEVQDGLGGNLCRCGTYMGVRRAVVEASRAMGGKNA
jgi:xanthine dehydrogenase YagT iron-sulfur-binding subunit